MSDLKSCPFCGGKAKKPWFNYDGSGGGSGEVTCSKCSSKVRGQYIPWTEADEKESSVDEAISAWNTRIIDPSAIWQEALEAAVEIVAHYDGKGQVTKVGDLAAIPNPYEAKPGRTGQGDIR